MKQKLRVFLTLLLCAVASVGWAEEVSDVLNNAFTGISGNSYSNWTGTGTSGAFYVGNSAGNYSSIQLRSRNNNSGVVTTTSGGKVKSITVKWESNTSTGRTLNVYGKNTAYSAVSDLYNNSNQGTLLGTASYDGNDNHTSTIIVEDNYEYIGFRSASDALYIDELTIVWEQGGSATNPSITAEDINIAYDATNGGIAYSITNEVDGGSVSAAVTQGDWLTLGNGTTSPISFTCGANSATTERAATVTLTYTYGDNQTVSKNVTVTQAGNPNVVDNISDITAAGAYTVRGTIVAKSQRGFIVGDGTGYVYYYNQNYSQSDYNSGDNDHLTSSVVSYGCVFEFNNSTTITAATESNYEAEDPIVLTGSQMDARVGSNSAQLSNYVQYQGTLSVSGTYYNITNIDGATTAKGSISYPLNTDFTSLNGKIVKVKGYYVGVSSSQYYNTLIGSIEEVVSTTPTIIALPSSLSGFNYVVENGPSEVKTISVSGESLIQEISLSLGANSDFEMSLTEEGDFTNSLTLTQNEGTVEATPIYVRLKAGLATGDYAGTITLTSNDATDVTIGLAGSVTEPEALNVTWNLSIDETATATATEMTWTSDYVTMGVAKGSAGTDTNNYYPGTPDHNYTSTRLYKNSELTITPKEGYVVTSVVFTATSEGYASALANSTWTNATALTSGTIVTVTSTNREIALSAIIGGTCGLTGVKVYYELNSDDRQPAGLSYSEETCEATIGGENTFPTLNNPNNLTGITYSSSDTDVATVDANDGTVNLVAAGTTTITASFEGNDNYKNGEASYVLIVSNAPVVIEIPFHETFNGNESSGGNDDNWSGSIADGDFQSDYGGWETVNAKGANHCVKAGTGKAGGSLTTPSLPFVAGKNYVLTFKAAAWNGNTENTTLSLSATGVTLSTNEVTLEKGAWTDYTVSLTDVTGAGTISFFTSSSNSRFFLDEVKVEELVTFNEKATNASDFADVYNANAGENKNVQMLREFGSYWNTLVVPFDLTRAQLEEAFGEGVQVAKYTDFNKPANIKFVTTTGDVTRANLLLVKPTATVTNPIFKGVTLEEGKAYTYPESYSNYSDGTSFTIEGRFAKQVIGDSDEFGKVYFLNKQGQFTHPTAEGNVIRGFRWFIQLKTPDSTGAKVTLDLDGEATSIEAIDNGEQASGKQEIFNLAGQRVQKAQKGIYIVNGKKVVVK